MEKCRRKKIFAAFITLALVFAMGSALVSSHWFTVHWNNYRFRTAVRDLEGLEDGTLVSLSSLTPFSWSEVYSFDPYTSKKDMQTVLGFSDPNLTETLSEGMVQLIFVQDRQVTANICGHADSLGFSVDLGEWENGENYRKISREWCDMTYTSEYGYPKLTFEGETFEGTVTQLWEDHPIAVVQIDADALYQGQSSDTKVLISIPKGKNFEIGDRVRVTYDGWIAETSPLELPGQMRAEVLLSDNSSDLTTFLEEESVQLAMEMDRMAENEEFVSWYTAETKLTGEIEEVAAQDYRHPVEIYRLDHPEELLYSYLSGDSGQETFEEAKEFVNRKLNASFFAGLINGSYGAETVAASTIVTTGKSYLQPEGWDGNVLLALVYDGDYSCFVTFSESGEGIISSSAAFVKNGEEDAFIRLQNMFEESSFENVEEQPAQDMAMETNESLENGKRTSNDQYYLLQSDQPETLILPRIILDVDEQTFTFSYDVLSSYLSVGTYEQTETELTLRTSDGKYHYVFDILEDGVLRFRADDSSDIHIIDKNIGTEITDGALFVLENSEADSETTE